MNHFKAVGCAALVSGLALIGHPRLIACSVRSKVRWPE
jgi:hypothetical protein